MPAALSPDTVDRLLDAADRLLARRGYARMTVEALAREVGIGKGSVYLLFPSKRAVALACIDRNGARVRDRLTLLAARREPAAVRLRGMLRERVMIRFDYARTHSGSLDALLVAFRAELLERRERQFVTEARLVATVVREGIRAGQFAARSAPAAAESLVTATNALLPFSLSVSELGRRRAVASRVDRIAAIMLAGLARHQSPGKPTS